MEFRTVINIEESDYKIDYQSPVMFVGSCFSSYMGDMFQIVKMPVMVNPAGTVYNPVSVANTLEKIICSHTYKNEDLIEHNGKWLSFDHNVEFSGENPKDVLAVINGKITQASLFLKKSRFLFITFGTSRVYQHKGSGKVVSNCHRIPARDFDHELLSPDSIVDSWKNLLDELHEFNPDLRIVFTVSPIRHWKDGAHGNQLSKSVLMVAIDELIRHFTRPGYFPAYEIMMDDLRDYRFYGGDLLHPSDLAVDYIWEHFSACYFDPVTKGFQADFKKIHLAMSHRILDQNSGETKKFASSTLDLIKRLSFRFESIDLSREEDYFGQLL